MKLDQYGLFDRDTNERLDDYIEDGICEKVINRPRKQPEDRARFPHSEFVECINKDQARRHKQKT